MPDSANSTSDPLSGANTSTAGVTSGTRTILEEGPECASPPVLKLKLKKPPPSRRVQWAEDTVDNEHMNKKKSKCCCVYSKPLKFGESESEDSDSDCEHCSHHKPKDFVASRDDEKGKGGGNVDEQRGDSSEDAVLDCSTETGRTMGANYDSRSSYEKSQLRKPRYFLSTSSSSSSLSGCRRHATKTNTRLNGQSIIARVSSNNDANDNNNSNGAHDDDDGASLFKPPPLQFSRHYSRTRPSAS